MKQFGPEGRKRPPIHNLSEMSVPGIPITSVPDALEQYKTLIRHVHGEPVMMRRAMRLAFRSLNPAESKELRDWLSNRYVL